MDNAIVLTIIIIASLFIFALTIGLVQARSELKEIMESASYQFYLDHTDPERVAKKEAERKLAEDTKIETIQLIQQQMDSEFTYLKLFKVGEVNNYEILEKSVHDIYAYVKAVYPDYLIDIVQVVRNYIMSSQLYQNNSLVKIMNSWV